MLKAFEVLSGFDWTLVPRTVASDFWHADWQGAYRRGGAMGVVGEAAASLAGTNTWPIFIPMNSGWGEDRVRALLGRRGIKLWGVGFAHGMMYFRVKKKQGAWAQWNLKAAGVPMGGRMLKDPAGDPTPRIRVYRPAQPALPGRQQKALPAPKGSSGKGKRGPQ